MKALPIHKRAEEFIVITNVLTHFYRYEVIYMFELWIAYLTRIILL